MEGLAIVFTALVAVFVFVEGGPLHASCKIQWELPAISDVSDAEIKGTHETPVKHYKDDISFKLTKAGTGCNGFSTSETWYAVLDYGTNYCNLENLITGAGLNATANYKETTSDDVCTQYSSHDCEKY
ncbi:hypothetical protein MAR_007188 [Mya arenaria]|uniref:Uncharacterized protein n=1 Tax=Mya arenaria TaxID=6604 RepID=A0ABY7DAN3_MYAAR|nr:hypothetical protein MAR_007188 [Mya arenaria]